MDVNAKREQARAALRKLRDAPPERSAGTKTAVLEMVREDIAGMRRDGYSVRQIAAALAPVFEGKCSPKLITQILRASGATAPAAGKKRGRKSNAERAAAIAATGAAPAPAPAPTKGDQFHAATQFDSGQNG